MSILKKSQILNDPEDFFKHLKEGLMPVGDGVTATVGGGTTGLIPDGSGTHVVTSDGATKQITLPACSVGVTIKLITGATGCELICATTGEKINNVICGGTNELALAADSHYICECISSTEWIVRGFNNLGADLAALVPDVL